VSGTRPAPFRGRHFDDVIIIWCVRWYLRYSLSYRDLKEMMAERGVGVDHVNLLQIGKRKSGVQWRWLDNLGITQRFRKVCG